MQHSAAACQPSATIGVTQVTCLFASHMGLWMMKILLSFTGYYFVTEDTHTCIYFFICELFYCATSNS
jgi:hypothetical protein